MKNHQRTQRVASLHCAQVGVDRRRRRLGKRGVGLGRRRQLVLEEIKHSLLKRDRARATLKFASAT